MTIGSFNPYRAPDAALTVSEEILDPDSLRPVPFEDLEAEPRFWPRVWAMFSILFRDPKGFVDRLPVTRSYLAPWRFLMVLSVPLYLLWTAVMVVLVFISMLGQSNSDSPPPWVFGLIMGVVLVTLPLLQLLGMLAAGLLNHGCLWIWGGLRKNQDLNVSMRASAYFFAYFSLIAWIPIIGSVAILVGPVFLGMTLARVHRTDNWRGICAAYTPVFLCCCAYGLIVMTTMLIAAMGS